MVASDMEYGISVHAKHQTTKKIFQRFLKDIREKMAPMVMKY
jgi:hypothetical protein